MTVILILSVLVILHELGHFFVARCLKIRVEEFGLGYPPKALKLFTWKETDFTLNWIPFGGFVRLWGEDEPVEEAPKKGTALSAGAVGFYARPKWQRLLVTLAGPITNALVALALFAGIFSVGGIPVSLHGQPRIAEVMSGTPAAQAGLVPHSQIVGFAPVGTLPEQLESVLVKTETVPAVQAFVSEHRGQDWQIVLKGPCQLDQCDPKQQVTQLHLRTAAETPPDQGVVGISFAEYEPKFYPWYEMPWRGAWFGLQQTLSLSQMMVRDLVSLVSDLVTGKGLNPALAGPIGIVRQAEKAGLSQAGWLANLNVAGVLSLNLAIMNILPIPALDGGRVLMILLEAIFGKRRVARFEGYVNYGGFIFLVGLLILISIRDIRNW